MLMENQHRKKDFNSGKTCKVCRDAGRAANLAGLVGDKATILPGFKRLNYEIVKLDADGKSIQKKAFQFMIDL